MHRRWYGEIGERYNVAAGEETMPTIEGKQAGIWINDYVKKAGEFEGVAKAVRVLVKNAVKGVEEYVIRGRFRHSTQTDRWAASWLAKST